ncbi:MAG: hypothetical protein AABY18_05775 [Candidatus Thermoplasmatota archaeon]
MAKAKTPRTPKPQVLRVDAEKYPGLAKNPALERALRIRKELEAGKPREEAVAAAEQAMGRRAPVMGHARPKPTGRPASGPRPAGKTAAPKRMAAHRNDRKP